MSFKESLTRAGNKVLHRFKKHAPEICIVSGVIIGGFAMAEAIKETLTVDDILSEARTNLDKIDEAYAKTKEGNAPKFKDPKTGEIKEYDEMEMNKDKFRVFAKTAWALGKKYAPALFLYILSIVLICFGMKIFKGRLATLGAAYAGLRESYKKATEYIKSTGQENEFKAFFNKETSSETKETTDENGNLTVENVEKTKITKVTADDSDYRRCFNLTTAPYRWVNNAGMNIGYVSNVQDWANRTLRVRGHLFLNEVYDMLGMERTSTGALCGWIYGGGIGDDEVKIAITHDSPLPCEAGAYDSYHANPDLWLEFNCEGAIYDRI